MSASGTEGRNVKEKLIMRELHFLILTGSREIVSVTLREGVDFLDELDADFGAYYILETA
jgi:hypothetical protein